MSTPVPQPCIRGCRRKAFDPDTREPAGTEPVPAEVGLLCADDAKRLARWLTEIPDLYATLDPTIGSGDPSIGSGNKGKISNSPALIRLDVFALLDPRTRANAQEYEPGDEQALGGDVPSLILGWAENLCDDLNFEHYPPTITEAVKLLAGNWFTNLCYRPWIGEMFDEIKQISDQLHRVCGVKGPVRAGQCHCGTQLYFNEDAKISTIKCRSCGHRMDGRSVIRLRNAQDIADHPAAG